MDTDVNGVSRETVDLLASQGQASLTTVCHECDGWGVQWTVSVNNGGSGGSWDGIEWMPIAPNVVVPARFTAEGIINGYKVSMVLESDFGVVECVQLSVEAANALEMLEARRRGETLPMRVTGDALRKIPVNYLVKESTRRVMAEGDEAHALTFMGQLDESIPPEILAEWPRGDVDVVLRWVASRYRRAAAIGDPPNVAVQTATGWSRATVNRALRMAREKGILGDNERGFGSFGGPQPRIVITDPDTGERTVDDLTPTREDYFTEFGDDRLESGN